MQAGRIDNVHTYQTVAARFQNTEYAKYDT
jgi:hypothetical protein